MDNYSATTLVRAYTAEIRTSCFSDHPQDAAALRRHQQRTLLLIHGAMDQILKLTERDLKDGLLLTQFEELSRLVGRCDTEWMGAEVLALTAEVFYYIDMLLRRWPSYATAEELYAIAGDHLLERAMHAMAQALWLLDHGGGLGPERTLIASQPVTVAVILLEYVRQDIQTLRTALLCHENDEAAFRIVLRGLAAIRDGVPSTHEDTFLLTQTLASLVQDFEYYVAVRREERDPPAESESPPPSTRPR